MEHGLAKLCLKLSAADRSLQLDALIPHRGGASVSVHSCLHLQAPVHKLREGISLSVCLCAAAIRRDQGYSIRADLNIGVLNAEYGRVAQPSSRNHIDSQLAFAARHVAQLVRLFSAADRSNLSYTLDSARVTLASVSMPCTRCYLSSSSLKPAAVRRRCKHAALEVVNGTSA